MHRRLNHHNLVRVTAENFYSIFMDDTSRDLPFQGAPNCPLVPRGKCDCRSELLQFALTSKEGHPCGMDSKCPVRTFLNTH